jgi:hypothetical protein
VQAHVGLRNRPLVPHVKGILLRGTRNVLGGCGLERSGTKNGSRSLTIEDRQSRLAGRGKRFGRE